MCISAQTQSDRLETLGFHHTRVIITLHEHTFIVNNQLPSNALYYTYIMKDVCVLK